MILTEFLAAAKPPISLSGISRGFFGHLRGFWRIRSDDSPLKRGASQATLTLMGHVNA